MEDIFGAFVYTCATAERRIGHVVCVDVCVLVPLPQCLCTYYRAHTHMLRVVGLGYVG